MSTTSPRQALRPVRKGMDINKDALLKYMQREGILPETVKVIQLQQFGHGQSNPTYLVQGGGREIVLRKQPPGKLLASAHAVHREHEVMKALGSTSVAVPAMLSLCKDLSVIGTTFFLMSFVDGRLFLDPNMPDSTPHQRMLVYRSMGKTLAALHSVDPAAAGLTSFGRPQAFCTRQVQRWLQQYLHSTSAEVTSVTAKGVNPRLPEMLQLAKWLQQHAAAADACSGPPCIVHGDFRLDNLVVGDDMDVRAVLDWELATLGNPMSDLAYNCLMYHLPPGVPALPRFSTPPPEGIPSEQDYITEYCSARGISPPAPADWAFFMSLSLFRAASILAGVYARALAGNASSASALATGAPIVVQSMAAAALKLTTSAPGVPFQSSGNALLVSPQAPKPAPQNPNSAMSPACAVLHVRLHAFMDQNVYPANKEFIAHSQSKVRWQPFPKMESLKVKARAQGLWNLWISNDLSKRFQKLLQESGLSQADRQLLSGPGFSNVDYAHLAKVMGAVPWCSEVFNCSAPDTGNMEVLSRYANLAQQKQWLLPLLRGDIRSCFAMTEPAVASSDATNIQGSIRREGNEYVIDGHKIWISGACDSRCAVSIFMGKTDPSAPSHKQQTMILVPMNAQGVQIKRPMTVFGADDAPHGHAEMLFSNVRVSADSVILGEGRGFEIAQGRLGPGRLHHCMRVCGMAEVALRLAAARVVERKAFGTTLAKSPLVQAQLAEAWLKVHCAWLSVLHAAGRLDQVGNKVAKQDITAAKVVVPQAALSAIDTAIQLHGAAGVGQDTELASLWGAVRTLRLADGPDEVHLMALGKQFVRQYGSQGASPSKL